MSAEAESRSPLSGDSAAKEKQGVHRVTNAGGHLTNIQSPELPLSGHFEPNQQTWRLFKSQFFHLGATIVLIALFVMTLVLWQGHNVSHEGKVWFNTVVTILNLALALNFLEAFKDMAKIGRWRILSSRPYTPREVDLILGGESLMKLSELLVESLKPWKPLIVLACASWIFLNFLAQATIALLSLNYSMDQGTNSTGIYTQNGTVQAPNLACYFLWVGCPVQDGASMIVAHTFGEYIAGQQSCTYYSDADIHSADQTCVFFSNANGLEFAYRYSERNPIDTIGAYPYMTDRVVKASIAQCYQYDIDFKDSPTISSQDGINDTQVLAFTNDTSTGHIPIPKAAGAYNSTTYVYNGTDAPGVDTQTSCGPRCLEMYTYRLGDLGLPGTKAANDTHIFSCQISVSEVYNATQPWHRLSDANARLAIASIALTGRFVISDSALDWRQYQLYTWGSAWEAYGLNATQVGANIGRFTIGALANMAALNPLQSKPGTLPTLGYHLDTNWTFVIILLVCIGVAHCFLVGAILWISRPIVVLEDSDLAMARLLHSLVGKLDGRGSLLDPKDLAAELQKRLVAVGSQNFEGKKGAKEASGEVIYGVSRREDLGGQQTLDVGEDVLVRKRFDGARFPKGQYA